MQSTYYYAKSFPAVMHACSSQMEESNHHLVEGNPGKPWHRSSTNNFLVAKCYTYLSGAHAEGKYNPTPLVTLDTRRAISKFRVNASAEFLECRIKRFCRWRKEREISFKPFRNALLVITLALSIYSMTVSSKVELSTYIGRPVYENAGMHWDDISVVPSPSSRFKICAQLNQLSRRGTEVAVFDYMSGLKRMHGNYGQDYDVTFLIPRHILDHLAAGVDLSPSSEPEVKTKFEEEFGNLVGYDDFWYTTREIQCHMTYSLISGELASSESNSADASRRRIPRAVHAVFQTHEPHGTAFASVSRELSLVSGQLERCNWSEDVYVDHIVDYPFEELDMDVGQMRALKRAELGIPDDSLVLCRHGGYDTFNIPFVRDNLVTLVDMLDNIDVILMNTQPLDKKHGRIHETRGESSVKGKAQYFAACDAMLHARSDGETFGLAVAEFSFRNKPVITYNGSLLGYARAHLSILKDRALCYEDLPTLQALISSLAKNGIPNREWNAYSNYSRAKVLPKFERVFILPAISWWQAVSRKGIQNVWNATYEDLPSTSHHHC